MTEKDATPAEPKDKDTVAASSKASADEKAGKGKGGPNPLWMGTAVGIGSAALVAALMYANRRNKK
jgi:hypothetical protein